MILGVMSDGPLASAIREAIGEMPQTVRSVRLRSSGELFMAALGCRALVCASAHSMLAGQLTPRPSPERMRAVVRAARAPGVKLVVAVVPSGEAYAEEERVLKGDRNPFVILRCAPLIEELEGSGLPPAALLPQPQLSVTTGALLGATVVRALDEPSWQGRTIEVPTVTLEAARAASCRARAARARDDVNQRKPAPSPDSVLGRLGIPPDLAYALSAPGLPRAA